MPCISCFCLQSIYLWCSFHIQICILFLFFLCILATYLNSMKVFDHPSDCPLPVLYNQYIYDVSEISDQSLLLLLLLLLLSLILIFIPSSSPLSSFFFTSFPFLSTSCFFFYFFPFFFPLLLLPPFFCL